MTKNADDLAALLAPGTAEEAAAALERIGSRFAELEAEIRAADGRRDDVLLRRPDTLAEHDTHTEQLRTEHHRHALACGELERILGELSLADRRSAAEKEIVAGRKAAKRAMDLVEDYERAAQQIRDTVAELADAHREIERAQRAAADADLAIPDDLALPHRRFSVSQVMETREVVKHVPVARNEVVAIGYNFPEPPAPPTQEIRSTERVVTRAAVHAPDLTQAKIVLPDPRGGIPILARGD